MSVPRDLMHRIRADGFHLYEGTEKWLARGITYGPFRPDCSGHRYSSAEQVNADFQAIAATGANVIRLYDLPNPDVAEAAAAHGLRLLIDISWPKHLDVYQDPHLQATCFRMVEEGVARIREWDNVLGVFLGNEIPADLVRWNGAGAVENLLRKMYGRAKALAPEMLVGFANFPSTEYLRLDFFDFIGFNVYLNEPNALRQYLVRLRHLYPEKPILLSECGLDSRNASVEEQRDLVPDYLAAAYESGLAGAFVFAWTDEWHTGGHDVLDWEFGLVDRERRPKPALETVSAVFKAAPQIRPVETKLSVVVATYNGGRTLRECLESLRQVHYSNYEVIVVDDGSTDNTQEILKSFPEVRVVSQENRGLSVARNVGIEAATGEIVVFTDSDCVVDRDWLYHIAHFMEQNPYLAGMGGPNITPMEDRLVHRAVALAPGHATHVLLSQEEAEHVPGCNMAFRRDALMQVGLFDPIYRKAGDDVDIIWRLQDMGHKIGFSTAAFVWHHRRPTMRGYLRQQRGYGEAEALLLRRHPLRFNDRGQSIWRGIIYPSREMRSVFGGACIRYGVFGTSGYQCIYERAPGTFWFYITSLEWWGLCAALVLAGIFSPVALYAGLAGALVSLGVCAARAARGWPSSPDYSRLAFPLVWFLWVLYPMARSGARYWHRARLGSASADAERAGRKFVPPKPALLEFWSERDGPWRVQILQKLMDRMESSKWIFSPNDDWQPYDFSVVVSIWFKLTVTTAEEAHGGHKRLLRMKFRLVPSSVFLMFLVVATTVSCLITLYDTIWGRWVFSGFLLLTLAFYRHACHCRRDVQSLTDEVVRNEGYVRVAKAQKARKAAVDRVLNELEECGPARGSDVQVALTQSEREMENAKVN